MGLFMVLFYLAKQIRIIWPNTPSFALGYIWIKILLSHDQVGVALFHAELPCKCFTQFDLSGLLLYLVLTRMTKSGSRPFSYQMVFFAHFLPKICKK
jgi:uncharacterized membrane protein YadS